MIRGFTDFRIAGLFAVLAAVHAVAGDTPPTSAAAWERGLPAREAEGAASRRATPGSAGFQPANTARPEAAPPSAAAWERGLPAREIGGTAPWRVLPVFGGGYVQNVAIAPSSPMRWFTYVDVGGPYRSDDGGRSWTPLHALMPTEMRAICADHVRALSVDPRDADSFVMAAGDRFAKPAGVFVTRDGGRTFRQTLTARFYGDGNRRWMGQCIARHPRDPDILYCGEDWDGLFRSDDNGETWRRLGLERTWISDIRIDPARPETLYVCAPEGKPSRQIKPGDPRERETGFFRSDDGGLTWRKLSDDSPTETAQIAGSPRIVGLFADRHVRVSDDGGETWQSFEEGLPVKSDDAPAPGYIDRERYQALAAGPDFWLVGNSRGEIYRREDDGHSGSVSAGRMPALPGAWRLVERASARLGDPVAEHHHAKRAASGEFWSLSTIIVDPRDPAHWLATDWFHIWETTDAGRSWTSRVNGMSQLVPFAIACDPFSLDNILYGMADVGLSASNDGGHSFHGGAPTTGANSIEWSPVTPGLAYCVGGKFGIQFIRTRDGGRTWQSPAKAGLPAFREGNRGDAEKEFAAYTVAVDPTTDDVFLCVSGPGGPNGGGVWRSHDQGESFERVSDGLPEGRNLFKSWEFDGGGEAGWTPQLVFSPDGSAVLSTYGGACYALRRELGGAASGRADEATAPSPSRGGLETAAHVAGWKPALPGAARQEAAPPLRWIPASIENPWCSRTIAADPFTPGRFLSAQGARLVESTDGGRTWSDMETGLDWFGWSVAFDAHVPGLVVAANRDDILVSRDGGRRWRALERGLAYPSGVRRSVVVDRGRLFALTRGSGVWTRTL